MANISPSVQQAQQAFPTSGSQRSNEGETWEDALNRLSEGDKQVTPFVEHWKNEQYETALRYAAKCTNPKMALLLDVIAEHKTEFNLNIDSMKDARGRTPLHDAGMCGNLDSYYRIMKLGANSFVTDKDGKSGADYRRQSSGFMFGSGENMMATLMNAANPAPQTNKSDGPCHQQ